MCTFHFSDKDTTYSFHQIHELFDYYGFDWAVKFADTLVASAIHWKAYDQKEPYTLLWYSQHLKHLVKAAFIIKEDFELREYFIVPLHKNGHPDLTIREHYIGEYNQRTTWLYFPRHLTAEYYSNPVKMLRRFCKYCSQEEWNNIIDLLLEYALCNTSINGVMPPLNIMRVRLLLLQLVEAAHLMMVRCKKSDEG